MEMKVYMHCDACEKKVRRTISKVEGEEVIRKLLLQASAVQLAYVSVRARNDVSSSLSLYRRRDDKGGQGREQGHGDRRF